MEEGKRTLKHWMTTAVCLLALCALAAEAPARPLWLPPAHGSELRASALKPTYDNSDPSTFSLLWTFSFDRQVLPGRYFLFELPVAHFDFDTAPESSTTIGNPYFGWRVKDDDSRWLGEFGFRLPIASTEEYATPDALFSDQVDGFEAWMPDYLTLQALATYLNAEPRTLGVRYGFGPSVMIYTGDVDQVDAVEVFVRYFGHVLFPGRSVLVGFGLHGRFMVSADNGSFDERSVHEFSIFAGRKSGVWRPAGRIRFPWDDELTRYLDPAFEISLGRGF